MNEFSVARVAHYGKVAEYAMGRELRALERQDFVWASRWAALAEDAAFWALGLVGAEP